MLISRNCANQMPCCMEAHGRWSQVAQMRQHRKPDTTSLRTISDRSPVTYGSEQSALRFWSRTETNSTKSQNRIFKIFISVFTAKWNQILQDFLQNFVYNIDHTGHRGLKKKTNLRPVDRHRQVRDHQIDLASGESSDQAGPGPVGQLPAVLKSCAKS